jgi:UDP:flavonoid glycosyltransferase YjiC (YdhE family)
MELPRAAGFHVEPVYTPEGDLTLEIVAKLGLVPYRVMREITAGAVDADVDCFEKVEPDLVVGDMRWTLKISSDVARVPYVSIQNAFWTRYRSVPFPAIDSHPATRWLPRRASRRLLSRLERPATIWVARAYREMRRRHGLDPHAARDLYALMEGDLNLVADIPEYATTSALPAGFHYVGPILWNMEWPDTGEPAWFRGLDPDRPMVYVTGGSSGHAGLLREAALALQDSPYQVVMTTAGRRHAISECENITVVDFAPGGRVMERADVVLCHGGNGTINQAIMSGRPVVGIARHVEQALHLDRVEAMGFGKRIYAGRGVVGRIRAAVDEVVAQRRYAQSARALQAVARRYNGATTAASHIDQYLAEGTP